MDDNGHTGANGDGRDARGRFTSGNPGGPGRPRRETERDYLRVLVSACPLDRWERIIAKAVDDAEAGDAKARDWLTRHLIGADPPGLTRLAAEDALGVDPVADLAASIQRDRDFPDPMAGWVGVGMTPRPRT